MTTMMKIKQKHTAQIFKVSDSYISRLLSGEREVSWKFAVKLTDMFPGKSLKDWKKSTPEELRKAFNQLKETA